MSYVTAVLTRNILEPYLTVAQSKRLGEKAAIQRVM
jgi:hypothetical protein